MKSSVALLTMCVMLTACALFAAPPGGNDPAPAGRGAQPSAFTRPNAPLGKTPDRLDRVKITRCLISAIDDVSVPAQEAGVLSAINVKEGQTVAIDQEQLLAQIDDRESQIKKKAAEIEVLMAKAQAESDVKVRIADKTAAVALAEYDNSIAINKRAPRSVPETEIRRQFLTYERQVLEAEAAKVELDVASKTKLAKEQAVEAAKNDIRKRRIEAPVSGVVDKVFKRVGEWVTPGEQVFRIVRVDRVRVEGFLSFTEISPSEVAGQPVIVEVQMKRRGKEPIVKQVEGVIEFVSPVVEGGEYRVWTEVDNVRLPDGQWMLHTGSHADMHIDLKVLRTN